MMPDRADRVVDAVGADEGTQRGEVAVEAREQLRAIDVDRRARRSRSMPTAWCRAWPAARRATRGRGASGSGSGRRWGSGRSATRRWRRPTGRRRRPGPESGVSRSNSTRAWRPTSNSSRWTGSARHVALAPDLVPPAVALGGDVGRLVVEAGQEGLGLAAAELEAGQGAADLVGAAGVGPADEAVGVVEA